MIVSLFRDIKEENWPSMELYADELAWNLQSAFPNQLSIRPVSIAPLIPGLRGKLLTASIYASRVALYPIVARQRQGDLNHIVDHTYAQLAHFIDRRRTIVTCHDLAPLVLRDSLPRASIGLALWDWALRGMTKAARIIADSENTRRDILRLTDYPAERVDVVYLGVGKAFHPIADRGVLEYARQRLGLPLAPVILHVGHCGQRKNIDGILMALKELVNRIETAQFVQVGGSFSLGQQQLIDGLGLQSNVRQMNRVSSADLPLLYNLADVFVFPSHYEGFGLPVLEAMACGTPVVCSNKASLPEIAGEAALTVQPLDYHGLADSIEKVLCGSSLRNSLAAGGLAQAKLFSWENCARRTFGVYQRLHAELS